MALRDTVIRMSRLLVKNELSRKEWIVRYYNLKAAILRLKYGKEKLDFLDPKASRLKNTFHISEYYRGNALYGIGNALKNYSHYYKRLPACIEHGVYFGDYVDEDIVDPCLPGIITFSDVRCDHIKQSSSYSALAIGPYINYVKPTLDSAERSAIKKKLGKVLLLFPGHSLEELNIDGSDSRSLLSASIEISERGGFDTILACVYYNDFLRLKPQFECMDNFRVVCAGNRYDPQFLSRLKTIILLSDYTLSDSVGTHVGYCVYLQKPHMIVPGYMHSGSKSYLAEVNEVLRAFSHFGELTECQYSVADKYWGFSRVRDPKEIHDYFSECERLMARAKQVHG